MPPKFHLQLSYPNGVYHNPFHKGGTGQKWTRFNTIVSSDTPDILHDFVRGKNDCAYRWRIMHDGKKLAEGSK